jgi:hypothetical protein
MPIDPKDAPPLAVEALERALSARTRRGRFATPKMRSAQGRPLELSIPHRVVYLPLGEIRRGSDLRRAALEGGWRFLIHEGSNEAIAAARVVEREPDKYVLSELSEGAFVSGTEITIRNAESLPKVKNGLYEAVLLLAPEVGSAALWLQDLGGDADLMMTIPTSSDPDSIRVPPRAMTPAEFLDRLQVLADGVRSR